MKIITPKFITHASIIAALYAVLTVLFAPISYSQIQVRISEALTVLPALTPAAIPGLFVGCVVANIFGGGGPIDIIFGSLATLLAAIASYKMPRRWLVPLPPVIINGVVIGFILNHLFNYPLLATMGWVSLGQAIACYGLGYPLLIQLSKIENRLFKNK